MSNHQTDKILSGVIDINTFHGDLLHERRPRNYSKEIYFIMNPIPLALSTKLKQTYSQMRHFNFKVSTYLIT